MSFNLRTQTYKPSKAKRKSPRDKKTMVADVKKAIKWNIQAFEYATTSVSTVQRSLVITMLKLNKVSPKADPTGKHTMQMIISSGYVQPSRSAMGTEYFDRDDLVRGLKSFAGVAQ